MIDLSFLTEAEQEAILKVLSRDAELKKAEDERVKHLQDVVDNENEFKYKSGQWFYDAKSKRHREKINGADLVRASIRKRKKPTTLAELSELNKDSSKRRWVSSLNNDIFIPPELYGVMEVPDEAEEDVQLKKQEGNQSSKKVISTSPEKEQDKLRNGTLSPPKGRQNPFNSNALQDEKEYNNEAPTSKPENVEINGTGKPKADLMSSLSKYGVKLPYPELSKDTPKAYNPGESQKTDVQPPVPKPRAPRMNGQPQDTSNSPLRRDDSFNGMGKPRGILKRRSSSSSTDSESIRMSQSVEPNKLVVPVSPIPEAGQNSYFDGQEVTDNSPDRLKHVRFSEKVHQRPPTPSLDPFTGREVGEFAILDPGLLPNDLDNGYEDHHGSEASIVEREPSAADQLMKILEQNAMVVENQGESMTKEPLSLENERRQVMPKDDANEKNVALRLEASTDPSIEPPSYSSSGEEPLYAVVKKTPAATSPSQEQDFDMDDALMEPRFHGQKGKTQNIYLNEKPLEFGRSFGGGGKMTYDSSRKQNESFSSDELPLEKSKNMETSYRVKGDKPGAVVQYEDDPVVSVPLWRRSFVLEDQGPKQASSDLTKEQKTSKLIPPRADVKVEETFGKTHPGNKPLAKSAPEESNQAIKYKSIFLQSKQDSEPKPVGVTTNMLVAQDVLERSKTGDHLEKPLLRENKVRRDMPKSGHFNVMSLKDRINETPKEQMSNPSQFQSLKHFWNVEEKNPNSGTAVTSSDKTLTHVSNRNKPTRTDLQQRHSEQLPDEVMLPDTLDSLSEEEQTSQKVASWLAQTPAGYEVGQMDQNEDPLNSGEEIVEHVQKSTIPKKSDEEFANALQKLREEALEVPEITERSRKEELKVVPQEKPDQVYRNQTTISISPSKNVIETKTAATDPNKTDRGFYERILQRTNKQSPSAKEMLSMEPKKEPFEETLVKTAAPEKSARKVGDSMIINNGISGEVPTEESNLPNEENEIVETIQKSAVPKSQEKEDFVLALQKLELEASKPSPLPDVDAEDLDEQPEEEIKQNTVSSVKAGNISYEHIDSDEDVNEFETPTANSVVFQTPHSYTPNEEPSTSDISDFVESIEKTTVPSRKENEDFHTALRKLELEAIEHPADEEYVVGVNQEVKFNKPENQFTLQTNLPEEHSKYVPSRNAGESVDDLEQPPIVSSYGLNRESQTGQPGLFEGQAKLALVEEPPIESTRMDAQENSVDFHNRLMRLEEQARMPEDVDDTVNVSQLPNQGVLISKKVYSSIESMPTSTENSINAEDSSSSRFKPEDLNEQKPHGDSRYKELANYPLSPEPSGSYTENRNILYKKPEVGSPEVSNAKQGMEESHPILSALRRSEAKMLNSKAVQEVSPTRTNQLNSSNQSEEDMPAPTGNSFPQNADTLKRMSQSVPTFLQDEVSGSVMSIYSGDFGNVDIKGGIEFSIEYVEQLKEFLIYVYQCRDLAVAEVKKQRSDPYVKAYLLPEKAKMGKRKTAVKKKTLNPVYNEILRYKIPKQSLVVQTLNLSVWHHDALGRNSFLGEVNLNLPSWDWSNTQRTWYQLEPRTPASGIGLENRGEMKLSLKYIPGAASGPKPSVTGEVYIWIKECVQLPMLRENKINSFVKCTVLPDTSRKSRQKTRTVDKTPSPIFNHTMVYDGFKQEDLREACVELTVWDHNRLSNHFLGGLRIGLGSGKSYGTAVDWMDSTHEESIMWEKMMASPNTWVDGMLPLRMFKMAKLAK